jgi:hypothetical protein
MDDFINDEMNNIGGNQDQEAEEEGGYAEG